MYSRPVPLQGSNRKPWQIMIINQSLRISILNWDAISIVASWERLSDRIVIRKEKIFRRLILPAIIEVALFCWKSEEMKYICRKRISIFPSNGDQQRPQQNTAAGQSFVPRTSKGKVYCTTNTYVQADSATLDWARLLLLCGNGKEGHHGSGPAPKITPELSTQPWPSAPERTIVHNLIY